MKSSIFKIAILTVIAIFLIPDDIFAQRRRSKKRKKKDDTEQVAFAQKLWYGGGFNLGLNGNIYGNEFLIGISPMVGYKVLDFISVGPRAEISYLTGRYDFGSDVAKLNAVSYGAGVFARVKSPFRIFGHFEYSYLNEAYSTNQVDADNNIVVERLKRDAFYLGLGYNDSRMSRFGYELYVLYDALAPENTVDLPIILRIGFTYDF